MSTQLKLRRGTTAQHSTFTGASGEVTVDTTKKTLVVHDGATAGGFPMAKEAFQQAGSGAAVRTVDDKIKDAALSVRDFGASPSATASANKTAFENALGAALAAGKAIYIPSGVYQYSGFAGLDQNNITIFGDGSSNTVLKYTGTGDALVLGTASGFRQGVNLSGFTVEGNSGVDRIIVAKAIARSQWSDINVREAKSASGIGFVFQGCMLNKFDFLVCSTDRNAMTSIPREGFNIEALAPYGNSSNNTFTNLYAEGPGRVTNTIEFGVRISGGDQNVFIGGSPESCGTYGLLIGTGCRYNTFIGVGMENLNATGADCSDAGISSRFINCYSSQKFIFQGRSGVIEGGYFERIQIDSGSFRNRVSDALVNGWATGAGGLYDSGTGTQTRDIYDADLAAFITDVQPRFSAYVPASVTNQTGAGAVATISFSELFDDNNNFAGNTFTAPVSGRYKLNATVCLDGISTAATMVTLKIVTTSKTYIQERSINPKAGGTQEAISLPIVAPMSAGDTAYVTIQVSGMAGNTVTILGNATNMWTTFSGAKV